MPRRVGVNGSHRAFVTRVHGLEHVEGLFAANFPNDDAIGAHAQAVDEQLTLTDGSLPFDVSWTRFHLLNFIHRKRQFAPFFYLSNSYTLTNLILHFFINL